MTAGHCVKEFAQEKEEEKQEIWKYRVRLGKTYLDEGVMIVPKKIICHPEYFSEERQ